MSAAQIELLSAHRRAIEAQIRMRQAARDRSIAIGQARAEGLTWSQIGSLLGVSRARAQKMGLALSEIKHDQK